MTFWLGHAKWVSVPTVVPFHGSSPSVPNMSPLTTSADTVRTSGRSPTRARPTFQPNTFENAFWLRCSSSQIGRVRSP